MVDELQDWLFTDLPQDLGFDSVPMWWPVPLLVLAGVLVGLTIRYLPGRGGQSPADGFTPGEAPPTPIELPSIFLAALAGLSLGVVIGPEAPLIALGGGLGVCAVRLAARDSPPQTDDRHRRGRQLQRHQHPAGLAPAGRVPAHGGVGAGRSDDGAGARPGPRRRGQSGP